MPSTDHHRAVRPVRAAVRAWLDRVGPGVYGVACSGGADSVALADATIALAGAPNVIVLTVDHGMQPQSTVQANAVARWARERGAGAVVEAVRVNGRSEEAARDARYAALECLAAALGLAKIFIGHTARDQAETVIMRIVRGTGPAGLAGIPVERDVFARPLLALDRSDIDDYLTAVDLGVWQDPMNADPTYTRVRFRDGLLPALRKENPNVDGALVRLAAQAREWTEALDHLAAPLGRFPIDCAALAALPAAIRKRALALALDRECIGYAAPHLEALDRLVTAPVAGQRSLDLPGGATIARTYAALDRVPRSFPELDPTRSPKPEARSPGYTLRTYRPGDRMRPVRLRGRSRKLSDLYADAKVPRNLRAAARVLQSDADGSIAWAEHLGLAFGAPPDLVPR